ncbi:hypothetical protein NOI87_30480, partial [Neorhizobium galegae]|uniref:hypothetical protein n=1 Tax=Neorhizobium galegae TaxID=399 RepID=UPI002102610F
DDGKKIMVAPAERSRERGGGGLRPALTGLSGLPRLSASQGTITANSGPAAVPMWNEIAYLQTAYANVIGRGFTGVH